MVRHDLSCITCYSPAGGLFGPVPFYHVCVDEWDECVRGRQAVWRLQHHGEPPVSAQTQRRRDRAAAGSILENILHLTAQKVSSHASCACLQQQYSPKCNVCDVKARTRKQELHD